ncbi:MAG: hypothetical protein A2Z25_02645 [Planctomycetes bacterium RBG_16_55_9]|nr:MAG: hypothetical protein A2Z25_02645 [Planctomycetes bacterium RBG_16_55_9]
MKVLVAVASISRNSGGMFDAVRGLAKEVHKSCSLQAVSLKDEFSEVDKEVWLPLRPVLFDCQRPRQFAYSAGLRKHVWQMAPDVIHTHGIWMYPAMVASQVARRKGIRLVVSPHGMLDSWALKNAAWKKKIAGWLYENRNLRSAACIHALCESEYQSIRAYGLKNPVAIIPNGVDQPNLQAGQKVTQPWEPRVDADKNVMLFLGRIHPKKGLENLIRAWGILKDRKLKELEQWHLVIAGWSQGGHENDLKRLTNEMNLGADVSFAGPLYDSAKDAALRAARAFILPSFSEGLPMAVLEAWAYRLPVIMTRECNIPEGFEADAALDIRPDVESITEGLMGFLCLSESEREQMGRNGLELVRSRYSWPKIAAQMVDVYKWVLGQSPKPECVRLG